MGRPVDSRLGVCYAATWIGAQANRNSHPFIQLGTLEQSPPSYEAFWSDTDHHFAAVDLGSVGPGSVISATMAETTTGWDLDLKDGSLTLASHLQIPFGAGTSFAQAEWIQEDPSPSLIATGDLPYPATSPVEFQRLRINGKVPRLTYSNARALSSENGTYLIPTRVRADSFSLVSPTGIARQYLIDAAAFDIASSKYSVALDRWTHRSGADRIRSVQEFEGALATEASALQNHSWPPAPRVLASELIQSLHRGQLFLGRWLRTGRTANPPIIPTQDRPTPYANRLRASIGLPPVQ